MADAKQNRYGLIFTVAGIAIAIIILGVAGSLLTTIDQQLREDTKVQVRVLTTQAANNAQDHLDKMGLVINAFTPYSADMDDIQLSLEQLKKSCGFIEVGFIGKDGQGIKSDGTIFSESDIHTEVLKFESGGLAFYGAYEHPKGGFAHQITRSVWVDGINIGTLYVDVPTNSLLSEKQLNMLDGKGYFILFESEEGRVLEVSPEFSHPDVVEGCSLYEVLQDARTYNAETSEQVAGTKEGMTFAQLENAVTGGAEELVEVSIAGETNYICVEPVGETGFYACGIIPEENLRTEADSINTTFILVFGIILVCLLSVLLMFSFFYRKRMSEKGLEMKTHLYGALSDSLDMSVNMYSPEDGVITPIVAKTREIIGYSMAEFMGNKRITDRIELSQSGTELLRRLREGEIASLERGEFSFRNRRTGEPRWVTYSVTPFYYEKKRQLLVVFRDSTNAKNLELSMREAMVAAEAANHAKSEFLSRMSHEIRTPLNAIIGMVQISQKHLDDPAKMETGLTKINLASDHLLNLINDVLDISKIESGKMMLTCEAFDFTSLIESVNLVISAQCEQKNQTFVIEKNGVAEGSFMGDRMRLQQVLINLLSNSVKYTPVGGHISLSITQQSCSVKRYVETVFVISDDGIGMTEEYQEHLFEPFVMEGRTMSQGTGLGMPIVKNILTMMNGDIQVESVVDVGTTFTVVVNLECIATVEDSSVNTSLKDVAKVEKVVDLSKVRVLLAEDNDLNAEIAKDLLGDEGMQVDWARNGEEVCQVFEESEPGYYDIILMDIQMPLMNGYEATGRIRGMEREDAKTIPIVAMSANAFAEDVQASLRSGMNGHLSKPIDIRLVLETIIEQLR